MQKETLTEWEVLDAEAKSLFGQGQYDRAGTVLIIVQRSSLQREATGKCNVVTDENTAKER